MSGDLVDGNDRVVEYLRVSVTDRCDLRCSYCMPPSGVDLAPRCEILRYRDLLELIEIFAELGVRKTRFTGGEPLIRKGIIGFLGQVNEIPGIERIALTTNGMNLARLAHSLKDAGVSSVNISLDSLSRDRFRSITGRDGLPSVLEGIQAAIDAGIESVKINMVVMGGVNDDEIVRFAELTRTMNVQIRFIEFMPATPNVWDEKRFVPMSEIKKRVEAIGEIAACEKRQWGGPARIFRLAGAVGEIGFISSVSRHFCDECNRVRLTSMGGLLTCLFGKQDLDLKAMLRSGASREEIKKAIRAALVAKNAVRHMPIDGPDGRELPMSCVGG